VARASLPRAAERVRDPNENDDALLEVLLAGDERAFTTIVEEWSGGMLRLALLHTGSRAVAEEVVQDAWLTVLRDLHRFERRSSLRTWVLGIVVNLARARARRERRSLPLPDASSPTVDPARFRATDAPRWPGHWAVPPAPWPAPDEALLAAEALHVIVGAVGELPPRQREVLVLRDLEGVSAEEACNVLGLSDTNQRVLLHRARTRVRNALERYFDETEPP
jgi:RNA polymerase sigma-70 factor (ECF subfamily)